MPKKPEVGIIGMGVMGKNLALNIESRGYNVSIYNRSADKTNEIIYSNPNKNFVSCFSIEEFVWSLAKPRLIFLMITAGIGVDSLIQLMSSYLEEGDILIDGGNSFYKDTIRRSIELSKRKINFIGLGISGGSEGALKGPSLMPGGPKAAYNIVGSLLKKIAARVGDEVCVEYIGIDGSGHYVKMIHNGIEYGDMQLIAEIYFLLKQVLNLTSNQLGLIFKKWNQGELNSYLVDITSRIIVKRDDKHCYILDSILDIARSKGTGSWASQDALDLGVPVTIIAESVFARYLSELKNQRIQATQVLLGPDNNNVSNLSAEKIDVFIEKTRKALYMSKIILYAQAFYQLRMSSIKYHWNLNYKNIAKIFRSGCIIRSTLLDRIIDIYSDTPEIENLLLSSYCINILNDYQQDLRDVIAFGIYHGIPVPALSSAISYYDSYRSCLLPANLIQAQRDYFGDHTYSRIDQSGLFHTEWLSENVNDVINLN